MKTLTVEFDFHKDWTIEQEICISDRMASRIRSAFREYFGDDISEATAEDWEDFFDDTDLEEIDEDGSAVVFNRIAKEASSLASELLDDPVNYEWDYRCISLQ